MGFVEVTVLLVVIATEALVQGVLQCPNDNWHLWDGKCYTVRQQAERYWDSSDDCDSQHAKLLVLDTQEELLFILGILSTNGTLRLGCDMDETSMEWTCEDALRRYYKSAIDFSGYWPDWSSAFDTEKKCVCLQNTNPPTLAVIKCWDTGYKYACEKAAADDVPQTQDEANTGLQCPNDNWHFWEGKCYTVRQQAERYWDSSDDCESQHAKLLVLDTQEELLFILGILSTNGTLRLGCDMDETSMEWTCEDGLRRYYKSPTDFSGYWPDWSSAFDTEKKCVCIQNTNPPTLAVIKCWDTGYKYACEKAAAEDVPETQDEASTGGSSQEIISGAPANGPVASAESALTTDVIQQITPTRCVRSSSFVGDIRGGRPLSGLCLQNHVIDTIYARLSFVCAFACSRNARCQSFNYYPTESKCELNSIGLAMAQDQDFKQVDDCYSMEKAK